MTVASYDQAARALKLRWRSGRIIDAFGSWRNAKLALAGERLGESAEQASLRRSSTGRRRDHEDHLVGLRLWLASTPASKKQLDYQQFREQYNARRREDQRPLVHAQTIIDKLGLPWAMLLKIAKGETTLEAARQEQQPASAHDPSAPVSDLPTSFSDASDVVDIRRLALILGKGVNDSAKLTRQRGFPPAAAIISGRRLWRRADVDAYRDGERAFTAQEGFLQSQFLSKHQLAARLGLTSGQLRSALRRGDRKLVPAPRRVGGTFYWLRSEVEDKLRGPDSR